MSCEQISRMVSLFMKHSAILPAHNVISLALHCTTTLIDRQTVGTSSYNAAQLAKHYLPLITTWGTTVRRCRCILRVTKNSSNSHYLLSASRRRHRNSMASMRQRQHALNFCMLSLVVHPSKHTISCGAASHQQRTSVSGRVAHCSFDPRRAQQPESPDTSLHILLLDLGDYQSEKQGIVSEDRRVICEGKDRIRRPPSQGRYN
ncbi:hypothetical protein F5883DRAFT_84573 [Diaporthe sp. PMI_573]|nr:hypothetical protein F5883DRAFT_84573 [Diaporthaceae sp. PMI_573]